MYTHRWVDVLRCISRWELLQQIASGMPTDAVLFQPPAERGIKGVLEKAKKFIMVRGVGGGGGDAWWWCHTESRVCVCVCDCVCWGGEHAAAYALIL